MECHIFFAWGKQIAHIHVASCQCTVHKYKVTNYPAAEGKEAGRPILGGMELISRAGTGKYSEREGGEGKGGNQPMRHPWYERDEKREGGCWRFIGNLGWAATTLQFLPLGRYTAGE